MICTLLQVQDSTTKVPGVIKHSVPGRHQAPDRDANAFQAEAAHASLGLDSPVLPRIGTAHSNWQNKASPPAINRCSRALIPLNSVASPVQSLQLTYASAADMKDGDSKQDSTCVPALDTINLNCNLDEDEKHLILNCASESLKRSTLHTHKSRRSSWPITDVGPRQELRVHKPLIVDVTQRQVDAASQVS